MTPSLKSMILLTLVAAPTSVLAMPKKETGISGEITAPIKTPRSTSKKSSVPSHGPKSSQEAADEICEVVMTEGRQISRASDMMDIPKFSSPLEVAEFSQNLRERLYKGTTETTHAFNNASDRADDSLVAIKNNLVTGGDRNATAIVELFAEFNKLAQKIAPPDKFSPSTAVVEAAGTGLKGMMKSMVKFVQSRGVEVPVTVEQWLQTYAAEAPDFAKMQREIQRALDDVSHRSRAAHMEIDKIMELIEQVEERKSELEEELSAHEANLSNLDPATQEEVKIGILVPLARDINIYNEYINGNRTLVLQKKMILKGSEDVVEELIPTVNFALPNLRNSAIAADDAMTNQRLAEAAMALRQLNQKSMIHTSTLIHSTAKATAELKSTAMVTPALEESVKQLALAASVTQNALDRQLPNLKKQMQDHDQLSGKMKTMLRQMPVSKILLEDSSTKN